MCMLGRIPTTFAYIVFISARLFVLPPSVTLGVRIVVKTSIVAAQHATDEEEEEKKNGTIAQPAESATTFQRKRAHTHTLSLLSLFLSLSLSLSL